jgi:hypothetical protein
MKLRTLFTLIWLLAVAGFANITGTLDFSGAGVLNSSNTKVAFRGATYPVASNGKYEIATVGVKDRAKLAKYLTSAYDLSGRKINLTQPQSWSNKMTSVKQYEESLVAAARSMGVNDTLYIVVGDDTLREVPITSWDTILPPNYVVQMNVGVTVPLSNVSNTVQVVWWDNDSIANVIDLGKASTSDQKYSGYIYTVYDDVAFRTNAHLYSLFVRTRTNDSIKSYTAILDVKAIVGDLTFAETEFSQVSYHTVAGYSLTPNDSNVARFNLSKTVSMTYVTDSTFDTLKYDSSYYLSITRDSGAKEGNQFIVGRNMRRSFTGTSKDTLYDTTLTESFIATALRPADTVKLKLIYNDSIQYVNVKAGDTLVFKETGNFGETLKFNYAWFTNIRAKVVRQITKQYWKL